MVALKAKDLTSISRENFKKEMFLKVNALKGRTYCSVMNTLIELRPFINNEDDYLKNNMIFMSLLHTYYSEFIKFICRTLTVIKQLLKIYFID